MAEFRMPSLGADMEAGTLARWCKAPGDAVERGEVLAEVETDKGIIEVECFETGTVQQLLIEPGTRVPVGTPLAIIGEGTSSRASVPETLETTSPIERSHVEAAPHAPPAHASPSVRHLARQLNVELEGLKGSGPHGLLTVDDVRDAAGVPKRTVPATPPPVAGMNRIRVSPAARRRAEQLGLDLGALSGSGPDGAIQLADVERAASALGQTGAHLVDPQARMRKAIAATVTRAKREIPHYYLMTPLDLGPANEWLTQYNADRPVGERLVLGALLLRAVALAARKMPNFNAYFDSEGMHPQAHVHLGVAISLRGGGLVTPALHDADEMRAPALMNALSDLVQRARTGKLRASELSEGTLSVTSLGERGVDTVIPVIQPPQVAMVGFGKPVQRPWVVDGQVVPRWVVSASLAADHRASDGHDGSRFLSLIENLLLHPEAL